MKYIIIGNGFDISLGLKTSYKDFISSTFFENLVVHNNSLAIYLKEKISLDNWVDIEIEIPNYSKKAIENNIDAKEEFISLKKALMSYLQEAQNCIINENSPAFQMLKKEIETTDLIFNFNYTNSVFRALYAMGKSHSEIKELHHYVHGSIENSDIILGVEDKADIDINHIFFNKSYNLNFGESPIGNIYSPSGHFVLFGHSLGKTDSSYFKDYFHSICHADGIISHLNLYYYGEQDELMKALHYLTGKNTSMLKLQNEVNFINSKE